MNKKIIIFGLTAVMLTGCSIETVKPEEKQDSKEEVVVEVPKFQARDITAEYIDVVNTKKLNVRDKADVNGDRVGVVKENDKFQVVSEEYDSQKRIWYEIEYEEGKTGFVAGWFCAKTKVIIYVEEDNATVKHVEALEPPTYIENPFKATRINVGDQIVGNIVKSVIENDVMNEIVFEGEIKLTGTYKKSKNSIIGETILFIPNEASSVILPRTTESIDSVKFYVTNKEEALKELEASGEATITIKNYSVGYGNKYPYNSAEIVKIDKK